MNTDEYQISLAREIYDLLLSCESKALTEIFTLEE